MVKNLTDEQKNILFKEATESPGTSPLNYEKRLGDYYCVGCGTKLFESSKKYDSGSGWPSFFESLPDVFEIKTDYNIVGHNVFLLPEAVVKSSSYRRRRCEECRPIRRKEKP